MLRHKYKRKKTPTALQASSVPRKYSSSGFTHYFSCPHQRQSISQYSAGVVIIGGSGFSYYMPAVCQPTILPPALPSTSTPLHRRRCNTIIVPTITYVFFSARVLFSITRENTTTPLQQRGYSSLTLCKLRCDAHETYIS